MKSLLLFLPLTTAFSPLQDVSRKTSSLQLTPSVDRIKSAGAGIPVIPPGDFGLFDPNLEGKLSGTDNLQERLSKSSSYGITSPPPTLDDAQCWLEDLGVPAPFAKATAPVTATVIGRGRLIGSDAPGDIQHVVLKLPEGFHYVEGQSLSVIPPGMDDKGKPHKPRLYSIASTRYGDLLDGKTVSLCVRRAVYVDPETGVEDPYKAGICSNFLCDAKIGDTVTVAGPVGKTMLLPEDPTKDIIMVATGTGIAPFRGFIHRLFLENTISRHMFSGHAWLILGVPTSSGKLYPQEFAVLDGVPNFELTMAISREMKSVNGSKLYVQDVLTQRADELFERLNNGAVIYFCGLKNMLPGILEALEATAVSRGMDWNAKLKELKANGQWHVEVY